MDAITIQKARLLDLTTSILEMTRDGTRDMGAVIRLLQLVKDDPGFAQRHADDHPAVGVRSLGTLTVTLEGKATNASQLIQQRKYTWVNPAITEDRFPIQPHDPVTCQLELFQFDHDPSWEEVLAERTRRNLDEPTYEQGIYLGIQHPEVHRQHSIVITHQPVRGPDGYPGVLVLYGYAGGRRLDLGDPEYGWHRDLVFAGLRK